MNQIIFTPFNKNENQNLNYEFVNKNNININKNFFKIQLFLSSFTILIMIFTFAFYIFSLEEKEQISNNLIDNYNISKLYANYNANSNKNYYEILGIIEIPKIKVYYPIFSSFNDDLLKIAPCKIYGNLPENYGNLCIAGHNYANSSFFSNINLLNNEDEIYIYDNLNKKYVYIVFDLYEVDASDVSPIYNYSNDIKQLTLITCNNLNSKRIILKAKQ